MNNDLQNLEIKVENEGTTPQGRLTATEWNILVAAVKSLDLTGGSVDITSILQAVANAGYATQEWVNNQDYATATDFNKFVKDFVTLDTTQAISGVKDFTNGLKVGGLSVYKSQADTIYLDANLVVRGGITAFGTNETITASIFDALPIDGVTLKRTENGVLYVASGGSGGTGGGISIADVENYLTTNGYATQSWVTGRGFITASASITGNAATATKLKNAVSLWGNTFNGSADVSGSIDVVSGNSSHYKVNGKEVIGSYNANYFICDSAAADGYRTHLVGKSIAFQTSTSKVTNALLDESGNFSITGVLKLPAVDIGFANPRITFGDTKVRIGATTDGLLGVYASGDIRINPNSATSANSAMGLWLKATGLNGVNNSSPTEALDVAGNILASGTMRLSTLSANAFNNAQLFFGANDARIGVNSSGTMAFYARAFLLRPASSATGGSSIGITIDTSSNILITGGITMNYSSDRRLKQNIRKVNASKALMSIGGVYQYEYVDCEVEKNHIYEGMHYGLIYQNVKGSALDVMCHEREDGMGTLNYLDTNFISLIAGATMENISEVEKLKRKIRTLENKVKQLERVA